MKKYIKPVIATREATLDEVMMITMSKGGGQVPGNGGGTSGGGPGGGPITEGGAKGRRGIFGDDDDVEELLW